MKNLTDTEIVDQVQALDAEVQALADKETTAFAQLIYGQAAYATGQAAQLHLRERGWGDLSQAYYYGFHLREAGRLLKMVNKMLSRRANRLANAINPPASKDDVERPDRYPHLN